MLKKILILLPEWMGLLLILNSCSADELSTAQYPVLDSDFIASTDSWDKIYWLDNHRVIFRGHEGGKPATVEEQKRIRWALFVWDTEKNAVTKYADGANHCVYDGYIYYQVKGTPLRPGYTSRSAWMEGEIGNEKLYEKQYRNREEYLEWRYGHLRNSLDCKLVNRPAGMYGRNWKPLISGHGFLDKGGVFPHKDHNNPFVPVYYHLGESDHVIELPLKGKDIERINYYPHKQAYLISYLGWTKSSEENGCMVLYWLRSTGQVEKECLSKEKWMRPGGGGVPTVATRKGYFVTPRRPIGDNKISMSGGYLVGSSKTTKLISGLIWNPGVSPDGCKVAFSYARNLGETRIGWPGHRELKMVELCKG